MTSKRKRYAASDRDRDLGLVLMVIPTSEGGAARLLDIPPEVRDAEIKVFEDAGFPPVRVTAEAWATWAAQQR